jgi:alkaline phosphatase D
MIKSLFSIILLISFNLITYSQIVSGPMLGGVELREARVWVEVQPSVKSVSLVVSNKSGSAKQTLKYSGKLGNPFNPVQFLIGGLEPNTIYQYQILIDGKVQKEQGEFVTKDLWQWRKPAPDFSFLAGSCNYVNEPVYDRPGKPYGGDSSIFESMANEKAAFMLWLGDNWYTREVDFSEWGLWYRPHHDRKTPVVQKFLRSMAHYATWDDHDFGPNDIAGNYIMKQTSREVFKNYWCNPSYGEDGEGVYTMMSYGDVDVFLCDDRWWRSSDRLKDSVNGKPNPEKRMLGAKQMSWLKNSLLYSQSPFKFVVIGSQVLNPVSPYDKLKDFSFEYNELTDFLKQHNVSGVMFLTGDRHHTEIIKVDREGTYPLYDITVSPLTSGTHKFNGPEANNPYRVLGIDQKQNYGRFSFSGPKGDRKMKLEFLGIKGDKLGEWSISEKDLRKGR